MAYYNPPLRSYLLLYSIFRWSQKTRSKATVCDSTIGMVKWHLLGCILSYINHHTNNVIVYRLIYFMLAVAHAPPPSADRSLRKWFFLSFTHVSYAKSAEERRKQWGNCSHQLFLEKQDQQMSCETVQMRFWVLG